MYMTKPALVQLYSIVTYLTCILWYVYTTLLVFCCYSDLEIIITCTITLKKLRNHHYNTLSICHTSRVIELTSRNGIGNGSRIHVDVHAHVHVHVQLAGYYRPSPTCVLTVCLDLYGTGTHIHYRPKITQRMRLQ